MSSCVCNHMQRSHRFRGVWVREDTVNKTEYKAGVNFEGRCD